jgi:calcineurin-like phosphoesterase family protein
MYFWTSDWHLGHFNIIKYCKRPFSSLKEMDETIISNCNRIVQPEDTLFFLGDFCLSKSSEASEAPRKAFDYYRSQIKCKNIIFVGGNHDNRGGGQCKTPIESMVIKHGGQRIFLTHDPKHAKEEYKFNLTGHVHEKFGRFNKLGKKSIIVNLSVEQWNYEPVNISDIYEAYAKYLKETKHEQM